MCMPGAGRCTNHALPPCRLLPCADGQIAELRLSHKQLTTAGLQHNAETRQLLPMHCTPQGAVAELVPLLEMMLSAYAAAVSCGEPGLPSELRAASGEGEVSIKTSLDAFPNAMMGGESSTTLVINMLPRRCELRRHAQSTDGIAVAGQYAGKDSHQLIKDNFGPALQTLQQLYDGERTVRVWVPGQQRPYEVRVRPKIGGDMASLRAIKATGGRAKGGRAKVRWSA